MKTCLSRLVTHLPEPLLSVAIVPVVHCYHAQVEIDTFIQGIALHQSQEPLVGQGSQLCVARLLIK